MHRILLALLLILAAPTTVLAGSKPLVQITSVTIAGDSSRATLTIRQGPIDLAALAITDLEGDAFALSASARTLNTGDTVTLRWSKAATDAGTIPITAHTLAATDDQLAVLLDGELHDAVAWSNVDGSIAPAELKDLEALVAASQWKSATQDACVEVVSGMTITRSSPNDTNAKSDWKEADGDGSGGGGSGGAGGGELPGAGPADLVLLSAALATILPSSLRRLRELLGRS